jgi:hypothetical protein
MDLIAVVRQYDVVVCIGSDERIRLMEGVLNGQIISIAIGTSPITEDKWLDPAIIKEVLRSIRAAR